MAVKRTSTKPKTAAVTVSIGVMGSATTTKKAAESLLNDFVSKKQSDGGDIRFVLPLTKDLFTPGVKIAADWAMEQEIPFVGVSDEASAKSRNLKPYFNNAEEVVTVSRIGSKLVSLLADGDEGFLFALFEATDGELDKAIEKSFKADIEVRDLANALDTLEADDDDSASDDDDEDEEDSDTEDDDDDDEEEAEEAKPPVKASKTKKATAEAVAAPSTNGNGKLSDTDVDRIAGAVVDAMSARLSA